MKRTRVDRKSLAARWRRTPHRACRELLAAASALAVAACAGVLPEPATTHAEFISEVTADLATVDWAGARQAKVTLLEYAFAPRELVFHEGVPYRLLLTNIGSADHYFTAAHFFRAIVVRGVEHVPLGQPAWADAAALSGATAVAYRADDGPLKVALEVAPLSAALAQAEPETPFAFEGEAPADPTFDLGLDDEASDEPQTPVDTGEDRFSLFDADEPAIAEESAAPDEITDDGAAAAVEVEGQETGIMALLRKFGFEDDDAIRFNGNGLINGGGNGREGRFPELVPEATVEEREPGDAFALDPGEIEDVLGFEGMAEPERPAEPEGEPDPAAVAARKFLAEAVPDEDGAGADEEVAGEPELIGEDTGEISLDEDAKDFAAAISDEPDGTEADVDFLALADEPDAAEEPEDFLDLAGEPDAAEESEDFLDLAGEPDAAEEPDEEPTVTELGADELFRVDEIAGEPAEPAPARVAAEPDKAPVAEEEAVAALSPPPDQAAAVADEPEPVDRVARVVLEPHERRSAILVPAQQTKILYFVALRPGTYDLSSMYGVDDLLGMRAQIVIE